MLASTKRGANVLRSFGWESVCHARSTIIDCRSARDFDLTFSALRIVTNAAASSCSQQHTSFTIASDDDLSCFMQRPYRSNSSACSETQTNSSFVKRPRSQLSSVDEDLVSDVISVTANAQNELDTKLCPDNVDISNVHVSSCGAVSDLAVESSAPYLYGFNEFSPSIGLQYDDEMFPRLSVSDTQSHSSCTVRSSFTLPHFIDSSAKSQQHKHQSSESKIAKHLMSAQDLSGYLKLRDLHPRTVVDRASCITRQYVTGSGDAEYNKTKSLDFRVSRLRCVDCLCHY